MSFNRVHGTFDFLCNLKAKLWIALWVAVFVNLSHFVSSFHAENLASPVWSSLGDEELSSSTSAAGFIAEVSRDRRGAWSRRNPKNLLLSDRGSSQEPIEADVHRLRSNIVNLFSTVRNSFSNESLKQNVRDMIIERFVKLRLETWTHRFNATEMKFLASTSQNPSNAHISPQLRQSHIGNMGRSSRQIARNFFPWPLINPN